MPALQISLSALRALLARAVVLWVLVRAMLSAVLALAARSSEFAAIRPNVLLVVFLLTVLGLVDLKRRGERLLWANLGVSRAQIALLFALVAVAGESLLALIVP